MKKVVVICPGRGSYTKETLGYLRQFHTDMARTFVLNLNHWREQLGELTLDELDSTDVFKPQVHTRGEHASSLILGCALGDFFEIPRDRFEVVAVTGNSMGWYLAMAAAGGLDTALIDGDPAPAFQVVNTMGSMMKDEIIGGQVIYPVCDEEWRPSTARRQLLEAAVARVRALEGVELYPSIDLGGLQVLGGNRAGISSILKELPPVENYPFQLINHAAFHTPLLRSTSEKAFHQLSHNLFSKPHIPMIDGRGHIWQPYSTDLSDLYHYTLGTQVVEPYDFTRAVTVALKEFAPDHLVLLGPGGSLGPPVAQILIANNWLGLKSKSDFTKLQSERPFVLAMGRPDQRGLVVGA